MMNENFRFENRVSADFKWLQFNAEIRVGRIRPTKGSSFELSDGSRSGWTDFDTTMLMGCICFWTLEALIVWAALR